MLFDALPAFYFDVLDTSPGVTYVQSGDATVVLSGDAEQSYDGVHMQALDVTLRVHGGALQYLVPPPAAQSYLQSSTALVIFFGGGGQEHTPAFAGQYGQTGNALLVLVPKATQSHTGGAAPGDILQYGNASIVFQPAALHAHSVVATVVADTRVREGVAGYAQPAATTVTFNFGAAVTTVSRIALQIVDFTNSDFVGGLGPQGGAVAVELALRQGQARTGLVSLTQQNPVAYFYPGADDLQRFDRLRQAVLAGSATIEVSGYESLSGRVLPLPMTGQITMKMEVVP